MISKDKKVCISCGRWFEKRKKWNDCWEEVKYCSKSCQKNKEPIDIMEKIIEILEIRGHEKSICPSEVLPPDQKQNKEKMELVRNAARLLAHTKKVIIIQKNKVLNPANFKGPIRLKLNNNS